MVERLFHGTPYEIHTSEQPFLDPAMTRATRDEDDPEGDGGRVFATASLFNARIYTLKSATCVAAIDTEPPMIVFRDSPPSADAGGCVYEVEPPGFEETVRRGKPTGKWVILEQNMPWVTDGRGSQVRGVPIGEPIERATMKSLIAEYGLRVFLFTDKVTNATFQDGEALDGTGGVRHALATHTEVSFMQQAVERGWVTDITHQYNAHNQV